MKRIAYLCPSSVEETPKAFNRACKEEFFSGVWCLWEDKPDVKYLKIRIKVIKKETRYKTDRKKKWRLLNLKRNK